MNRTVDLSGVTAKVGRAEEHFQTLRDEIEPFLQDKGHGLSFRPNADATEYVMRVHFARQPDTRRWGLIFGDCVHNLRSALDHLVYSIAVAESQQEPPPDADKLMFPIKITPQGFRHASYRIASLSDDVRALIEGLQPYVGPQPHDPPLLQLLEDLDVLDKHRLITVTGMGVSETDMQLTGLAGFCSFDFLPFEIRDGAPILRITLDRPTPGVQVHAGVVEIHAVVSARPDYAGVRVWDATGMIATFIEEVRRVVGIFSWNQ